MEITIGEIILENGVRIPYAAENFTWKTSNYKIVEVNYRFVKHEDIPIPSYINWDTVVAITSHETIEVED